MIGPWVHGSPGTGRVGARDFTNGAAIDYPRLVLDWCDLHARGIDRGLGSEPPVRVFVMGANEWRTSPTWPLPSTARTYYLRAGGRLTTDAPAHGEAHDTYTFDPNHPVEDPHYDEGLGPRDQRAIEARADVLTFTTPPLEEDVEVIGHIEFRLWIASSAPDTDFICRLIDVEPDGTAWNLMSPTLEVLRAKYRHGETEPVYLTPGRPEELTLRLGVDREPLPARTPYSRPGDEQLLPAPRSKSKHRPPVRDREPPRSRAADDLPRRVQTVTGDIASVLTVLVLGAERPVRCLSASCFVRDCCKAELLSSACALMGELAAR